MSNLFRTVPLQNISDNPYQTRTAVDWEYIRKLEADIYENGLLEIPAARETAPGEFQLAFGHNRLKAFRQLASEHPDLYGEMPLRIVDYNDEQMALTAWSENESRKQLNPVERAQAVKNMIETFGWSQQQVADKLRLDRSTVANMLRLLNLPTDELHNLAEGVISQRQAMALLPWYELTEIERGAIHEQDYEVDGFISLARNGQFDSDSIRAKVAEYLDMLKPKELFSEPPAAAEDVCVQTIDSVKENSSAADYSEGDKNIFLEEFSPGPQISTDDADFADEPAPETKSEEKSATKPEPAPAAPTTPTALTAPPQPTAQESLDTVFTITWQPGGAAMAGLRAPKKNPAFRFFPTLDDERIPAILTEMRQVVGI